MNIQSTYSKLATETDLNKICYDFGNVKKEKFYELYDTFQGKGWFMRKITCILHIPSSLIIKTIYHLSQAVWAKIRRSGKAEVCFFKARRDIIEAKGWFLTLFRDRLGQFYVQESSYHKCIYEKFSAENPKPQNFSESSIKENSKEQRIINRRTLMADKHFWDSIKSNIETLPKHNYGICLLKNIDSNDRLQLLSEINDFLKKDYKDVTSEDIKKIALKLHSYNLIPGNLNNKKFTACIEEKEWEVQKLFSQIEEERKKKEREIENKNKGITNDKDCSLKEQKMESQDKNVIENDLKKFEDFINWKDLSVDEFLEIDLAKIKDPKPALKVLFESQSLASKVPGNKILLIIKLCVDHNYNISKRSQKFFTPQQIRQIDFSEMTKDEKELISIKLFSKQGLFSEVCESFYRALSSSQITDFKDFIKIEYKFNPWYDYISLDEIFGTKDHVKEELIIKIFSEDGACSIQSKEYPMHYPFDNLSKDRKELVKNVLKNSKKKLDSRCKER